MGLVNRRTRGGLRWLAALEAPKTVKVPSKKGVELKVRVVYDFEGEN